MNNISEEKVSPSMFKKGDRVRIKSNKKYISEFYHNRVGTVVRKIGNQYGSQIVVELDGFVEFMKFTFDYRVFEKYEEPELEADGDY